ncbi:MAG: PilN domain-containing protein, partial [Kiritimatiellia bacterium]|nr:PilN domain-containing protein [Kiritimatiellia bacterium]
LVIDELSAELVIAQDGSPSVFVSLGAPDLEHPEGSAAALAEEAAYALESIDPDGAVSLPLQVWLPDPAVRLLLAQPLEKAFGPKTIFPLSKSLSSLSVGIARRALQEEGLNLLPADWRNAAASRKTRRRFWGSILGLLGVWGAILMLGFTLQSIRQRETDVLKLRLKSLEAPAKAVRDLQSKIAALEQYADRSGSALECLRETVLLLPEGVELTSFTFRKGVSVVLRGQARAPDPVYDFIQALQASERFTQVNPSPVQTRTGEGAMTVQFAVTCLLTGNIENETNPP